MIYYNPENIYRGDSIIIGGVKIDCIENTSGDDDDCEKCCLNEKSDLICSSCPANSYFEYDNNYDEESDAAQFVSNSTASKCLDAIDSDGNKCCIDPNCKCEVNPKEEFVNSGLVPSDKEIIDNIESPTIDWLESLKIND
jgi:hypothetical protein